MTFLKNFLLSLILFAVPFAANGQSVDLNDAIKQLEAEQPKAEESESEKARNYLNKTITRETDKDSRLAVIIMTYVSFEHRFLEGYPSFCRKHGADITRFKTVFQQANADIRSRIAAILQKDTELGSAIKKAVSSPQLAATEEESIAKEFREVAMAGFSYDEMCDTFNGKTADEPDISFKRMYPEFANELLAVR